MKSHTDRPVGVAEIASHLDRPEITIRDWRKRYPSFPKPLGTVSGKPYWMLSQIKEWQQKQTKENRKKSAK